MTPEEARNILAAEGVEEGGNQAVDFKQKLERLEAKIERAPTMSLKDKYRKHKKQLEEAWDIASRQNGDGDMPNFPSSSPSSAPHSERPYEGSPSSSDRGSSEPPLSSLLTPPPGSSPQPPGATSGLLFGIVVSVFAVLLIAVLFLAAHLVWKMAESKKAEAAEQDQHETPLTNAEPEPAPPPPAPVAQTPAKETPAPEPAPAPAPTGPTGDKPWTNSLGMKFVPAGGEGILFGVWDVRVQDFQAFESATNYEISGGMNVLKVKPKDDGTGYRTEWELDPDANWQHPGFDQSQTSPVVGVSWTDAQTFCEWLTDKERKDGTIGPDQAYRLPHDSEWSQAAGSGKYPWGDMWPPPDKVGNYGDEAYAGSLPRAGWSHLPDNDGYARTSPVGSFPANAQGLYDMGGNVWQWCDDWYTASMNSDAVREKVPSLAQEGDGKTFKVLRGGAWYNFLPELLLSSCRMCQAPGDRYDRVGFRVVLVTKGAQ